MTRAIKTSLPEGSQERKSADDDSLLPTPRPTPGRYYQIRKGDVLLSVAGKAYEVKAGTTERLEFARRINRHPLNGKYLRGHKATELFPEGLLSFLPEFSCDVRAQIASIQQAPAGDCFAVIWIPVAEEIAHPNMGKTLDIPSGLVTELLRGRTSQEPPSGKSTARGLMKPTPRPVKSEPDSPSQHGSLSLVADVAVAPFRFICSVMALFPHPFEPGKTLVSGPATGTLIGDRHVLTAAHVVYNSQFTDDPYTFKDPIIIVTPGDDSPFKNSGPPENLARVPIEGLGAFLLGKSPVGSFVTTAARFPRQWQHPSETVLKLGVRDLFDYAVIELRTEVGKLKWKQGRFGYWGSSKWGVGTRLLPQPDRRTLEGEKVSVSGYPVDRVPQHGIAQWKGKGLVNNGELGPEKQQEKYNRARLGYMIATEEGQSGAPVWRTVGSGKQVSHDLLGVHGAGGFGIFAADAVLLTPKTIEDIKSWMQ